MGILAKARGQGTSSGWTRGWEANPILPASPRWSFGNTGLQLPDVGSKEAEEGAGKKKAKHKARITYLDKLLREGEDNGTGELIGPGSHDPLPVERVFQQPKSGVHGPRAQLRRDRGGGGLISTQIRLANLGSLREYPPSRLPSCAHTPGPGSYTQFTSFGAASGPTRVRYFPTPSKDPKEATVRPQAEP